MVYISAYWQKTKKIAKFVWRHFFTLSIVGIGISASIEGPLNWKNGFLMIVVSAFLDWLKQFIKLTPNVRNHRSHEDQFTPLIPPLHNQWWNPSIRGTPAYFIRHIGDRYN